MAHVSNQVLGRNLDAESVAKILNVAQLTLSNAATAANEPLRKGEFDTAYNDHESRIAAMEGSSMHLDAVYVDTTSPDLATALAAGSHSGDEWTFGGKVLSEGDLLILNAATQQDEARSWVHNGGSAGDATDFTALASDIDAAIQSAVDSVIGDAAVEYNTLGKIEDKHIALDARVTTAEGEIDTLQTEMPLRPELKVATAVSWTDNGDGTYTASVSNPFPSTEVHVQIQSDAGAGAWTYHFAPEFDMSVNATNVEISTSSTTLSSHAVKFLMTALV
ncbi:hypothetical protein [Vibrio phage VP41s3]|nr:hypothetical protein [Vibrio phage VP41s3]